MIEKSELAIEVPVSDEGPLPVKLIRVRPPSSAASRKPLWFHHIDEFRPQCQRQRLRAPLVEGFGRADDDRPDTPQEKALSDFFPGFWDSQGWGFGLSIITERDNLAAVPGRYGRDGGYGTSWYADPKEEMIGILMTQRVWDSASGPGVYHDFWTPAYQAFDD